MSEGNDGWGCAPVFLAVILGAGLLLFGSCTVLPGIDKWTASNTQQAAIRAQAEAQIAQLQAQRDLEIAKAQAQRDIEIAQQQAQAEVQTAALNLAGRAVDSTAGTLRMLLLLGFAVAIFAMTLLTAFMVMAYYNSRRRKRTPRWMLQSATGWQPAREAK